MRNNLPPIMMSMLVGLIISACGPSQIDLESTSSQVAADIFATQTSGAPTATMTFTPSPTITETTTMTPSPLSTRTATITPTPTPILMAASLTLDDLPVGFRTMPDENLVEMEQDLPQGAIAFGFSDEAEENVVMGQMVPIPSLAEQVAFDAIQPKMIEVLSMMFGADDPETLTGLDELGDSRASSTFITDFLTTPTHMEIIVLRRGEIGVILIVAHSEDGEPSIDAVEIADLLDERLVNFMGLIK